MLRPFRRAEVDKKPIFSFDLIGWSPSPKIKEIYADKSVGWFIGASLLLTATLWLVRTLWAILFMWSSIELWWGALIFLHVISLKTIHSQNPFVKQERCTGLMSCCYDPIDWPHERTNDIHSSTIKQGKKRFSSYNSSTYTTPIFWLKTTIYPVITVVYMLRYALCYIGGTVGGQREKLF